ncbi:hypothetical protein ES288_D11G393900v1 [Gossypium darwinii]|uniref:Disease resistance N-terminal domain-containing protein n=1 Tax=Gossypium darwinii TaxID=34276 RepID=A0A5D2AT52_GOSDA|nr:hypothetical protein ES288_D11G393900v1 [Gossypium darwinii]
MDLKSTISTIKAVLLDAEEQSMTSSLIKDWLEKLKDAFYDADNFSTDALRKDLLSRNKLMKEVCLFFSSSNQFVYGAKMGHQIKARMFNLVECDRPIKTSFITKKRQRTHSFVSKDEIIGREDDKAAFLEHILEFQSEENVYVVPIVEFGGLGMTTLAQFVNEVVNDHFELRICKDSKLVISEAILNWANQRDKEIATQSGRYRHFGIFASDRERRLQCHGQITAPLSV